VSDQTIVEELQGFFAAYNNTFAALSRGERTDGRAMLDFYAVPVTMAGDAGATLVDDESTLVGSVMATAADLATVDYDRSEQESFTARVVNQRTAVVDIGFVRRTGSGAALGRLHTTFVVVRGDAGWRIVVLATTPL
jgi:hypothetical protein